MSEPSIIERSAEKAHIWLDEVAKQLAAQPPELRGVLYEGWNPSATPVRYRGFTEFLDRVAAEPELAGEIEDVRAQLPENLQPILG